MQKNEKRKLYKKQNCFTCDKCGKRFCNQLLLRYHHKWECGRQLNCMDSKCKKTFTSIRSLRRHLTVHQIKLDYNLLYRK